jgi:cold shock CspA family protein
MTDMADGWLMQGTVARYSYEEGHGAIEPDDNHETVHFSADEIRRAHWVKAGQRVAFDVVYGTTGAEAVDIYPL